MVCDICGREGARVRRVARTYGQAKDLPVIENIPMCQGFPPAVIRYEDRPAYYAALEKAHQQENEPFLILMAGAVERSLDMYLAAIEPAEDVCHSAN